MKTAMLLLGALALCAPAVARAAEEPNKGACKADYEKFCKDVKPGGGRIIACMKEHASDLSDPCKAKMAKAEEKMAQAKADFDKACGDDAKTLCGDVQEGHGAVLKCLRQNKAKVSEGCKTFVAEKKEQRKARREKMKARRAAQQGGSDSGSSGGGASDGGKPDDSGSQE